MRKDQKMNYEQLLDEIMVNTLAARDFFGTPQENFRYSLCPFHLELHTTIFLAGSLLMLDQQKPVLALIQIDELPADMMLYTGQIGPHFGRSRKLSADFSFELSQSLATTDQNPYPYLDKLFAYLAVINTNSNHSVLFIKK